jgi:hypothetical protein
MATVWDLWLRRTTFAVTGPTSDRYGRSNGSSRRRVVNLAGYRAQART